MNRTGLLPAICVGLILASSLEIGRCEEPTQAFLQGLRDRGYHDTALDYLNQLERTKAAPPELLQAIGLEKAISTIDSSRSERDSKIRNQQLDQAEALLNQFIQAHGQHSRANSARTQLGNLIVERARIAINDSKKGNKQALLADAKKKYESAYGVFSKLRENVGKELDGIPKVLDITDSEQAKLAERRTLLRADYLETLLRSATIREEMADTVDEASPEYKKLLEDAAGQYENIYKKYRTRLAGLYARMFQGRANQKLGNLRDALGFYVELLDQPDEPAAFRTLKTKTLRLAMDCWLDPTQKKFVEAIRRGGEWSMKAKANEQRDPDWLYIRLRVANGYQMQADEAESLGESRTATLSRNEARKHAQAVARYESEYQREAQELVALLGGPDRTDEKKVPQNFVQARKAGKKALDALPANKVAVKEITQQVAKAPAAEKEALNQKLAAAKEAVNATESEAFEMFRLALTLAEPDTPTDDVNLVRYFLSYLYYLRGDLYEAALIGEFVARRYPDTPGARQCAKIAMACYLTLHSQSPDQEKDFESRQVVGISEHIVGTWPGTPEQIDALATLVPFMINEGQVDRARQYLSQIPESSPKRGESELKTGRAMWQMYLEESQKLQASETPPADVAQKLEKLKGDAQLVLAAAIKHLPANAKLDIPTATAMLSLAQSSLETQKIPAAIAVLEEPKRGLLTLVRKGHPSTKVEGFAEEAYKAALRAYIGSLSTGGNPDDAIKKAQQIMGEMKTAIGSSTEGQKRLVNVYVGLARDLEEQLKAADPATKQALSKGFDAFLTQLSSGANELSVLNWVAETFMTLGSGFDNGLALTPEAASYFQKSEQAFQNILDKAEMSDQMRTQVQVRLANIKQKQRNFEDALTVFQGILKAKPMTLNVQVDAARALYQWAQTLEGSQKAERLKQAMMGAFRDAATKKNVVWGWGRIAQVTSRYPKFKEIFNESRFNLALCRLEMAETKQGAERDKLLKMAKRDVELTKKLYGLGEGPWTAQYDALLKRIQKSAGEPEVGLKALEPKAAE